MTKEAALIQQSSGMLTHALDWVFGPRLLSWKSVSTSIGLSMISLVLFADLIALVGHRNGLSTRSLIYVLFFVMLSFAPGKLR
jgi:hypothetical protein